jgi:hypothetical protein
MDTALTLLGHCTARRNFFWYYWRYTVESAGYVAFERANCMNYCCRTDVYRVQLECRSDSTGPTGENSISMPSSWVPTEQKTVVKQVLLSLYRLWYLYHRRLEECQLHFCTTDGFWRICKNYLRCCLPRIATPVGLHNNAVIAYKSCSALWCAAMTLALAGDPVT